MPENRYTHLAKSIARAYGDMHEAMEEALAIGTATIGKTKPGEAVKAIAEAKVSIMRQRLNAIVSQCAANEAPTSAELAEATEWEPKPKAPS